MTEITGDAGWPSGVSRAYCTKEDVDDILSEDGTEARYDDDHDAELSADELARIDRVIIRASVMVGSKLKRRFKTMAGFEGGNPPASTPESVRYMTAVIAAYYTSMRRGNPVSEEIRSLYREALEWLDKIARGDELPIDLHEQMDNTSFVSNFNVDGSYRTSKVRVTRPNSTRAEPPAGIRRARELFYGYPWE